MTKADWTTPITIVHKPWGHEQHYAVIDGHYCGKVLHINAGHSLSLQYHQHKDETVSVHTGRILMQIGTSTLDLETFDLTPGESVHIKPGTIHRMTALTDSVVLEASTPQLDDVVRLDDHYGRQTPTTPDPSISYSSCVSVR